MHVAAIWHNPGGANRAGAGDYPVVILGFENIPQQTVGVTMRAIAVDTGGRLWAIATDQLTVQDADVTARMATILPRT